MSGRNRFLPAETQPCPICCCMTLSAASALQYIMQQNRPFVHCRGGRGDGSAQRVFCPWRPWPLTLTFKLVRVSEQTCLPCEFGANPFSRSRDIWFTNKKTQTKKSQTALKQNLTQFTACGNNNNSTQQLAVCKASECTNPITLAIFITGKWQTLDEDDDVHQNNNEIKRAFLVQHSHAMLCTANVNATDAMDTLARQDYRSTSWHNILALQNAPKDY